MRLASDVLEAEAKAELVVLAELDGTPMYPIEVKPEAGQTRVEIRDAVERCETTGWVKTGPARGPDPRTHLTTAGRAELASRRSSRVGSK
jgi:hypothetical protein